MGANSVMAGQAAMGLVGGAMNSAAARRAQAQQVEGINSALDVNKEMYDKSIGYQSPWRDAGLSSLADMQGEDFKRDFKAEDFQKDPGYDFRMAEGQKALERSAAAKGGLGGGAALKGLARYGQDFASNEYGNAYNRFNADRDRRFSRLGSIANMGQHATDQMQSANQFNAMNAGDLYTSRGGVNAGGTMAANRAWTDTLSNLGGAGAQYGQQKGRSWL